MSNQQKENTTYEWKEDQDFVIKGTEYGLLRSFVQVVLDTPETRKVILGLEAEKILSGIFEKGVEDGTIFPQKKSAIEMPAPRPLVSPTGEPLSSEPE